MRTDSINTSGFTLVEVLVAVVAAGIGILGIKKLIDARGSKRILAQPQPSKAADLLSQLEAISPSPRPGSDSRS